MLRKITICIILMLIAIGYGQVVFSEARSVPKMLNYQGYLTDTLGSPIDDSLDMTFKIYDAATLGNELWSESQLNVPVERGIFSALLGSGTPIPDTVFTTGTDRWLELTLEGPQTLSPRTRITAMGYAYTSTYSDTAEYAMNAGADTDWVISGSDMYSNVSGNVGIGTTSPAQKLHVVGNASVDSGITANNLAIGSDADFSYPIYFHDDSITPSGDFTGFYSWYTRRGGSANENNGLCGFNNHLVIASGTSGTVDGIYSGVKVSGGQVGTEVTNMDVRGLGTHTRIYEGISVHGNVMGLHSYTRLKSTGTIDGDMYSLYLRSEDEGGTIGGNSYMIYLFEEAGVDYGIYQAGSADNYFGGNLGIGTSPTEKLDVNGTGQMTGFKMPTSAANGYVLTSDASGVGTWQAPSGDNDWVRGTPDSVLFTANNLGIARGGAGNMLYGDSVHTHINLGAEACTTGTSGQDLAWCTVGGGRGNAANGRMATVAGGYDCVARDTCATVGGGDNNTASGNRATVAGGRINTASAQYATVSGGQDNTASGVWATVGGGNENSAGGSYTTVAGGDSNTAGGFCTTVGGGYDNNAGDNYSTVSGGTHNTASEPDATVGGGGYNTASGTWATVAGGFGDTASAHAATVGGGEYNTASSYSATVAGGRKNFVDGDCSAILGGDSNTVTATADYSYLFGIKSKLTQDSTFMVDMPHIRFGDEVDGYEFPASDGANEQVMVTDGSGQLSWIDGSSWSNWAVTDSVLYTQSSWGLARGGANNMLYGDSVYTHINFGVACTTGAAGQTYYYCTVGGGHLNIVTGNFATVAGGQVNTASGNYASVAGGYLNTASGLRAAVGGGAQNTASAQYVTVGGGSNNTASANRAVVAGGRYNHVEGDYSAILGGYADTISATADYSYLFGIASSLTQDSTFMVDMPHIRFGDEVDGYEFPASDGANGQVMVTDGSSRLSWTDGSSWSNWAVTDSVLYTNSNWGLARGGADNMLYGDSVHTHVNFGVACTIGTAGQNYKYSTVSGGYRHIVTKDYATVGGGFANRATHPFSTVAGGSGNKAIYSAATVGGGSENEANLHYATVAGGVNNTAGAHSATVAGGRENLVEGDYSAILGGYADTISATADYSYLFGIASSLTQDSTFMVDMPHIRFGDEVDGYEFPASDGANGQVMITDGSGQLSWTGVPADTDWVISGSDMYSGVSGNVGIGAVSPSEKLDVAGTAQMTGFKMPTSATNGYVLTSDAAGVGIWQPVGSDNDWVRGTPDSVLFTANNLGIARGGAGNILYGDSAHTHINLGVQCWTGTSGQGYHHCTVGGGYNNRASNNHATVTGGRSNVASGSYATVGGGNENTASGTCATVAGGDTNTASGLLATVGGGEGNRASGVYSTAAGGYVNHVGGDYSAILGGYADTISATADYSYLFGIGSNLTEDSTFMVDMPHIRFGDEVDGYEFPASDGANGQVMITDGSGQLSWTSVSGDTDWVISGSDMYSGVSGNVGIGTASPGAHLEVYDSDEHPQIKIRADRNAGPGAQAYLTLDAGTASDNVWSIYNSAGEGYLKIRDDVANEDRLTVDSLGNVGIGTVNPAEKLDVAGTVQMTGFKMPTSPANGYVLTSDASGVGAWQAPVSDNDWVRGTPDSVLFTANHLGIARGGANNVLYGDSVHTHINLGVACTTGTSGQDYLYCAVGGGWRNTAGGFYATVAGGHENVASDGNATVGGGDDNTASGYASTIAGGRENTASGDYATVGGGYTNNASNNYATVAGGYNNSASDLNTTVGGGRLNTASDEMATIAGGYSNDGSGYASVVAGGYDNVADTSYTTVAGGRENIASGYAATVAGGYGDTCLADHGFTANSYSRVRAAHTQAAAFNGQTTTGGSQVRCDELVSNASACAIDHPLDPNGKILNHYTVASTEMLLTYRGIAFINENGTAEVRLPDFFDACNKNPMIQLTGVGTPDVFVAEDVRGNRFVIGGEPGTKVYWTVTGERKDQPAEIAKTVIPVEQPKTGDLYGHSIDDDYLFSARDQLEQMGRAAEFQFRTGRGQARYENSKRQLTENK